MVSNEELLEAGLEIMKQNGKTLVRTASAGRAMLYKMHTGESVRVRTCNDHVLIVVSDKHTGDDAKLNIEGTDWLLMVMPEVPRSPGSVIAYLVPVVVAAKAARMAHKVWLDSKPNTKGDNKTWNLWFEDGSSAWDGFAEKWGPYRLKHTSVIPAISADAAPLTPASAVSGVKAAVEAARASIAAAAGISVDGVKITIQFGL